ncbi:hypothetical protein ACF0H5_021358 [Mactra antiquata]
MSSCCLVADTGLGNFDSKFKCLGGPYTCNRCERDSAKNFVHERRKERVMNSTEIRVSQDSLGFINDLNGAPQNGNTRYSSIGHRRNGFNIDDKMSQSEHRGRPSMEHPTRVFGEVTKHWTPVFALLEHKYTDPKREDNERKRSETFEEIDEVLNFRIYKKKTAMVIQEKIMQGK